MWKAVSIGRRCIWRQRTFYIVSALIIGIASVTASLHDIGKIHIPDAVLNKPGRLTEEEFEVMKTHTVAGQKFLERAREESSAMRYRFVQGS